MKKVLSAGKLLAAMAVSAAFVAHTGARAADEAEGKADTAGKVTVACADADERFSDAQVLMSEAFSSVDFDVAKKKVAAARQAVQRGRSEAGGCGCAKAADEGVKATELLDTAMDTLQFAEVQDRLFEAIKASETARSAAETCWRSAVGSGTTQSAKR